MEIAKPENLLAPEYKYDRRTSDNTGFISPNRLALIDFALLNASFFLINLLKRGTLFLPDGYITLLLIFYVCWFLSSIMGKKFRSESYSTYGKGIFTIVRSSIYLTYVITLLVVVFGFSYYSRVQVFSTCLVLFLFNCFLWSIYNKAFHSRASDEINLKNLLEPIRIKNEISYQLLALDFFLVVTVFFFVNFLKRGHWFLLPEYNKLLVILLGLWFVFSVWTQKFSVNKFQSIYFFIWQWIKASGLMLATMSLLIFGLRMVSFSRFQVFGSIALLMPMEFILAGLYYRIVVGNGMGEDIESVDLVKNILIQDDLPLNVDINIIRQKMMEPAREKFRRQIGENNPDLFELLDHHIDLKDMVRMETIIERSCELFEVSSDRVPKRLLVNQWKVNDIRWINQFFLKVHQILLPGGYYVAHANTIVTHHKWIYQKFPRYIANFIYVMDFCFKRIMPKLPGLQKIYFSITKGKGRIISRAEFLGRLCFCGFEIVAEKEIGQKLYVIARKVKTSSLDKSPTYGPLVKLKRSGFEGKVVQIYKFRTMHPYSEYLQQYVYDLQGLQAGGKIEDDFRTTSWGKFMRKYWLDELPMFYNWLKGDMNLVGVRPLSFHYLSLYDSEFQELRKKVKPGLIPPFYADLPKTFEEICDSERKYIQAFLKSPVSTQCSYFVRAFINIVIKGARSK